ncbi:MAG: dicarboxylate/amino acid:cation symporter [bacterium]
MEKKEKSIFSNLGMWILIATVLGMIVGLIMGPSAKVLAPIGDLFIQLIKMVVMPMIFFSLIGGAASLGKSKSAGFVGIATFVYYTITSVIAVILGLIFGELFKPGVGLTLQKFGMAATNEYADKGGLPGFWETIIGFIPANPFEALVNGNVLQVIVFALFLGFAVSVLPEKKRTVLLDFFNYLSEALIKIMMAIMYIAPLGVLALMADAVGTFGYEILVKIMYLLILYVIVLAIITFGVQGLGVKFWAKQVTYKEFFKSMYKVQLFAFSTASSMATLPLNMATTENELKVSKETTSFALPLGATINMDGNAAYYAMAACFFAQMFGMDLSTGQYVAIIVTSTLGAIGQAGVPGPTLLLVAVLMAADIPITALPILFGVDRIFDMLRTAVNVTGDAACATIVDSLKDRNKL